MFFPEIQFLKSFYLRKIFFCFTIHKTHFTKMDQNGIYELKNIFLVLLLFMR